MATQETNNLSTDLHRRPIRVHLQPIDALDLERHVTLEHVVDVRHARHPRSMDAKGGLCPPGRRTLDGGAREGA